MGVRVPADLEMVGMPLQTRHPTTYFPILSPHLHTHHLSGYSTQFIF
jgi:hypothetical protein